MRAVGTSFVVAVIAGLMLTGCSDSGRSGKETTGTATSTTATATTTTTTAARPAITSFEVGDLSCGHGVAAPVSISWKTANATAVLIALDNSSPTGYGPAGSTRFYVACTGAAHTISIIPLSDTGHGARKSKKVSPA